MTKTKQRSSRRVTCALTLVVLCPLAVSGAEFHVSGGADDGNPGTPSQPFATLQRAQQAVRAKVAAGLTEDVQVVIRAGTYRLSEPLVFGPDDGGSDRFKVTYAAQRDERVVISGGRVIEGWRETGDGTWRATIPPVAAGDSAFRQLFVNGRRAIRARHPNTGYLRVEQVGADRRTHFRYNEQDIPAIGDLSGVELVFLHDWSISRVPVKTVDRPSRTLRVHEQIGGNSRWAVMDWFEKHPRYYLENAAEFLDAPGEWYLDTKAGVLTYQPLPGETLSELEVVAPVAEQSVAVRGSDDRPVKNLHFAGLTFAHVGWSPDDGIYWGRQACTYWSPATARRGRSHDPAAPAALHFEGAESCALEDCAVAHVGPSAVWIGRRCRGCAVTGCVVSDAGGNGIMVGEGQWRQVNGRPWWQAAPEQAASGNRIGNNLVEHCGQELFGAVGVWVGLAARTTVAHNEIRALPYTGVSVGWMWWDPQSRPEPRATPCRENIVADNHIHHVMQVLSDGGGIYTLGLQPESSLRGNVIHDVPANVGRAESNGMFLDQGTGGFVIADNVIYNVDRSPLRFHKGWKNLVRGNVLAVKKDVPLVRYNDTRQERIELEDNTVVEVDVSGPGAVEEAARKALRTAGPEPPYRQKMQEQVKPKPDLLPSPGQEISLFDAKTLGSWKVTDFGGQGDVSIKDGAIYLGAGSYATGITWTGPVVRMDYEITLDAMRVDGTDFFCALTFPVEKDPCTLVLGGWGGQLCGLSTIDFYDAANNQTTRIIPFANGRWYRVRLRVVPHRIQAWLDGDELVDVDTTGRKIGIRAEMDLSQPLGIATWITTGAVRDIRLKKLSEMQ